MTVLTYLIRSPISIDALVSTVASPACGGTCLFLGTVRDTPEDAGGGVTGIDYSAYEEMAEAELGRILDEARDRWPGARVGVVHRIGLIPVGEASIAIAAAAPHRAQAFDACRYVIEQVKQRLPMWKKEHRSDGSTTWVNRAGRVVEVP